MKLKVLDFDEIVRNLEELERRYYARKLRVLIFKLVAAGLILCLVLLLVWWWTQ